MTDDDHRLEGWWRVESLAWDGQPIDPVDDAWYHFGSGKVLFIDRTMPTREQCFYRLEPERSPGHLILGDGSSRTPQVYAYHFPDDDTLLLCESGIPGGAVPDVVETVPGDGRRLIRLIRDPDAVADRSGNAGISEKGPN